MVKISRIYHWLVGYKSRGDYYSCGKFAEWIRRKTGVTEKPFAATSEEWCEWKSKNVDKVGYWITEEVLNYIQDVFLFIPDVYHNAHVYVSNRWVYKTHYIDTKLKRGKYYGFDTVLLAGIFELLVDFVEIEKAHRQQGCDYVKGKKIKYHPSREDGIKYLDWEIGLSEEEGGIGQSATAQEIKDLYVWWKDVLPNRIDPMEESGWSAYCEGERIAGRGLFDCGDSKESEESKKNVSKILDVMHELEKKQDDEDTDMLVRLIKIRKDCWT